MDITINKRHTGRVVVLALLLAASILVPVAGTTPAALAAPTEVVFDDMEHGNPFGNGWFSFGGSVGGGGIGPNSADLPPGTTGSFSLETGWGSGGTPGFFGGFGRTNPVDLAGTAHFNFWINPDAGQDYTLEINLQDDDDGDDGIGSPADDEFQYNCVVSAAGPCASSGGGWQLVSIPLADFFDDNSFLTGGNGVLDPVPVSAGGNGQLVNVVFAVISNSGADVNFRTDDWVFTDTPLVVPTIIDDFESGLPVGTDGDGNTIGFFTFNDPDSSVAVTTTDTPPAAVPGSDAGNNVLLVDTDVNDNFGFAGVIHAFENAALDTWVPQDWSKSEGISFWLYGNNTGSILFVDILDNRNPGSTVDDAERFSIDIIDDFSGWQFFEIPFSSLNRKEVGNGAPNDGLGLTEVHGWAFGVFNAGQAFTNYIDDVFIYGVAELPELAVQFTANDFEVEEGATATITVGLNRALGDDDPAQVSVDYSVETIVPVVDRDYFEPAPGTLTFTKGGMSELSFTIETIDDGKYEPTERLILRLSNPGNVALGTVVQASASIIDNDAFDPLLLDDFEGYPYLWDTSRNVGLANPELAAGDPLAVPDQGAYERVLEVTVPIVVEIAVEGRVCNRGNGVVPVVLYSTDVFDATTVDHTTVTFGAAGETHVNRKTGVPVRHEEDVDGDGDLDLVFHFRFADTGYECDPTFVSFDGFTFGGQPITNDAFIVRDFAIGQDWSGAEALSFWFYGQNTGEAVTVDLLDNRAPDPGPAGWSLVWADEFDDPAGTPPDPENWGYEVGDGIVNGIPGWGNSELQYYTADPANAATDGNGNLVITAQETAGFECYYGPCEYTSARLVTKHKAEFAYGRIESRILVPDGEAGLWPAFWSLGTDIDLVDWPQTGEIDFMEYVSRLPNEIFGTIHGPGYSGGASFGNEYDFGEPVYNSYHTFAIEWEPDVITWYVDDILYHTATPADVAPNEWVFNDPVYFLLNLAIGGNFGGPLDPNLTFPQSMAVDYVRVYQGPDTAERFEASFVDDFSGWQQVVVPFASFTRSAEQPDGAPDDGLTLTDVWGYGFDLPDEGSSVGTLWLDQVRLVPIPPPTEIVVTNLNDSGAGSLRQAIEDIADDGTITFDPALAGGTINLTSGPIVLSRDVTIDAIDAPGLSLDGGGSDRVLINDAGTAASVANLTMANGYGFQLAGCVLNNGDLILDHVLVTGCTMTTDSPDFWQGGGGIYNGEGSTLNLIDSTVSGSNAGHDGGGVFSFFNTQTNVVRSTISGNVATNVGGGLRLLGNASIVNSTISGNTSTAWHGGALFLTDGVLDVDHTTVAANVSPAGTAALFVGTFGPSSATMNIGNSVVSGSPNCFLAPFGAGAVAINSLGNNVFTDGSCNPVGSDQVVADALLGPLADNGGPTLTHALLAGSPAIDAVPAAGCPATDQRGVARPQGAACDAGSFELE